MKVTWFVTHGVNMLDADMFHTYNAAKAFAESLSTKYRIEGVSHTRYGDKFTSSTKILEEKD
jgi:hypothetical protein